MKYLPIVILLLCLAGGAAAKEKALFDQHEGIRVWHGVELPSASSDAALEAEDEGEGGSEAAPTQASTGRLVDIPSQPPIHEAGYRIRCRSPGASSCLLSDVVVDVFNQPAIRRVRNLPSTTVWIGTETRDREDYAVASVFRRGVPVHQWGIPDDWRIRTHMTGVSSDPNIPVKRLGASSGQNIKVHRVGVSSSQNIRVHGVGRSGDENIRVHRAG